MVPAPQRSGEVRMMAFIERSFLLFAFAAALWSAACAESTRALKLHVDAGRYGEAVDRVEGDPEMEADLAAVVLEHAASTGVKVGEAIQALSAGQKSGRRALGRLEKEARGDAAKLAKIALIGRDAPDKDTILRFLDDESSDVRTAAAQAWCDSLDANLLKRLLLDIDPRVRLSAVKGLARFEGTQGTDLLLKEALRLDPDPKVRSEAARNGKALGSDALYSLKIALGDESMGVRLDAVSGLAASGDPEALRVVEDLARGALDETAVAAAAELARLGSESGRKRLDEALVDERAGIRQAALLKLDRAGIEDREKMISAALKDKAPRVALLAASMLLENAELKGAISKALNRIAEQGGVDADDAKEMLAAIGDDKAVAHFKKLFENGSETEITAALGSVFRSKALRSSFVKLMADKREAVRIAAAMAVLKSQPKI